MSLIQIDDSKCKKDDFCVQECPASIISQPDKKNRPEMVDGGDQLCLACGHCVAVCPHGALSHKKTPLEECPPIAKELIISQEQAIQFLRSRRSIRNYKKKPVEKEMIQTIIDIARYAPTGGNSQAVEWIVHMDKNTVKEIAELTVDWMRSVKPYISANLYIPMEDKYDTSQKEVSKDRCYCQSLVSFATPLLLDPLRVK